MTATAGCQWAEHRLTVPLMSTRHAAQRASTGKGRQAEFPGRTSCIIPAIGAVCRNPLSIGDFVPRIRNANFAPPVAFCRHEVGLLLRICNTIPETAEHLWRALIDSAACAIRHRRRAYASQSTMLRHLSTGLTPDACGLSQGAMLSMPVKARGCGKKVFAVRAARRPGRFGATGSLPGLDAVGLDCGDATRSDSSWDSTGFRPSISSCIQPQIESRCTGSAMILTRPTVRSLAISGSWVSQSREGS